MSVKTEYSWRQISGDGLLKAPDDINDYGGPWCPLDDSYDTIADAVRDLEAKAKEHDMKYAWDGMILIEIYRTDDR